MRLRSSGMCRVRWRLIRENRPITASDTRIANTTITGNAALTDLAGGLRSLGDANVLNSTFSDNTSTAWHGGGIFHTDGTLTVTNSTFVGNNAPAGTASGIVVATFGAPAEAILTNNVLEGDDGALACAVEGGAAAVITSAGGNIDTTRFAEVWDDPALRTALREIHVIDVSGEEFQEYFETD